MKSTPLKKKSKQSISLIQNKIWEHCKRLTREKYGNKCYTCHAQNLIGSNWQTGHFFPKASLGAYLKYDLRVLRPQCYHCNINLGGNGARFYQEILKAEGQEYINQIEKDKQILVKAIDHYLKILDEYEKQ